MDNECSIPFAPLYNEKQKIKLKEVMKRRVYLKRSSNEVRSGGPSPLLTGYFIRKLYMLYFPYPFSVNSLVENMIISWLLQVLLEDLESTLERSYTEKVSFSPEVWIYLTFSWSTKSIRYLPRGFMSFRINAMMISIPLDS